MTGRSTSVRAPAVAGQFYPADGGELARTVAGLLDKADPAGPVPKAIIAPHAGYIYSGPIAASAYARIGAARHGINKVVLLGPAHRVFVPGIAAPSAASFLTPMGKVKVDGQAVERACRLPGVELFDAAFDGEHCLEVQLPFLQSLLADFELAPFLVGNADEATTAALLDALWGGPETLIVISSDLSHFQPHGRARDMDEATSHAIEMLSPGDIGDQDACGRQPIKGLLRVARERDLRATTLDLRTSGDTAGDRGRVVGYGAWVFEEDAALGDDLRQILLHTARQSIQNGVADSRPLDTAPTDYARPLRAHRACFVTLESGGVLRGCVGSAQAHRALVNDVAGNAYAAAFADNRFSALKAAELSALTLSISILGPKRRIAFSDDDDLIRQLVAGRDGLLIEEQGKRGLFLPQVWDSLPDGADFLRHLKAKAGLPAGQLPPGATAHRFTTETFGEA